MLLNGFEFNEEADQSLILPKDGINILFAGRLEPLKNADLFLETMLTLIEKNPNKKYTIFFAGYGSMLEELRKTAESSDYSDRIHFLGQLTPSGMKAARVQCDIHVSMNEHGNLTNVNIEAMADGMVVIVPNSNSDSGVDSDTDQFIPPHVFYRYGALKDSNALISSINKLSEPEEMETYQKNAKAFAKDFLKSWDNRISQEVQIFKDVIS